MTKFIWNHKKVLTQIKIQANMGRSRGNSGLSVSFCNQNLEEWHYFKSLYAGSEIGIYSLQMGHPSYKGHTTSLNMLVITKIEHILWWYKEERILQTFWILYEVLCFTGACGLSPDRMVYMQALCLSRFICAVPGTKILLAHYKFHYCIVLYLKVDSFTATKSEDERMGIDICCDLQMSEIFSPGTKF